MRSCSYTCFHSALGNIVRYLCHNISCYMLQQPTSCEFLTFHLEWKAALNCRKLETGSKKKHAGSGLHEDKAEKCIQMVFCSQRLVQFMFSMLRSCGKDTRNVLSTSKQITCKLTLTMNPIFSFFSL